MTISFVCILVLSACCQICFADPGKSIENKNLLDVGALEDVLDQLEKLLAKVLDLLKNLVGGLTNAVGGLLGNLLSRASKFELSPSSIEKINQIGDLSKQIDVMLDTVEVKSKEEGFYNDVRTNLDAVKREMKTIEKEMQKMSGKKSSGSGGLLGGILG